MFHEQRFEPHSCTTEGFGHEKHISCYYWHILLGTKWQRSVSYFRDFQTSIVNQQDQN